MRIALMSDIHANREAFTACLAHAQALAPDRFVFLGDYVGYGGDPGWVVETLMAMVERGAIALRGNHDAAIADGTNHMNDSAAAAIDWTRAQLGAPAREFLARLPMTVEEDGRLYVHGEGSAPERWRYVEDAADAWRSLGATQAAVTVVGHVHVPAVYGLTATNKVTSFRPTGGVAVPLLRQRRWLAVLGSVGQPRDRDPAASYAMLDVARAELTFHRVPYDIEAAAARIRAAGLPESLAARLFAGR
ncbi:MAG: metallophosphoesterase family protein [Alphaproteobacteria bacterium]|nr:metallophosphoesterase family protein [Alphaproteobacteria bacterium]